MKNQFQLELFKSQQYQTDNHKTHSCRVGFFGFIRLYEKAISIIIILFISSLVSFSLGVEKGKRSIIHKKAKIKINKTQAEKKQSEIKQIPPAQPAAGQALLTGRSLKKENKLTGYTIQVATFKTKTYAQKEAKRLKKKGLDTLVIPKGKFVCVCVGKFNEKQKAKVALNKLKKSYQDCFIRRL